MGGGSKQGFLFFHNFLITFLLLTAEICQFPQCFTAQISFHKAQSTPGGVS